MGSIDMHEIYSLNDLKRHEKDHGYTPKIMTPEKDLVLAINGLTAAITVLTLRIDAIATNDSHKDDGNA